MERKWGPCIRTVAVTHVRGHTVTPTTAGLQVAMAATRMATGLVMLPMHLRTAVTVVTRSSRSTAVLGFLFTAAIVIAVTVTAGVTDTAVDMDTMAVIAAATVMGTAAAMVTAMDTAEDTGIGAPITVIEGVTAALIEALTVPCEVVATVASVALEAVVHADSAEGEDSAKAGSMVAGAGGRPRSAFRLPSPEGASCALAIRQRWPEYCHFWTNSILCSS